MAKKYFSNIVSEDNTLTFHLKNIDNTIPIPFANAVRRIMISEINTVGINKDSINILNNRTVLHNDFIKERLSLLPIKFLITGMSEKEDKIEINENIAKIIKRRAFIFSIINSRIIDN